MNFLKKIGGGKNYQILILSILFLGCFLVSHSAEADYSTYLNFSANDDIVEAGGYGDIPTTAANFGGGATERHYLNYNNLSRIRQNGTVDHFQMYVAEKPAELTAFYIEIWRRKYASNNLWDRICQEDVLSQMEAGQTVDITLSSDCEVQEGDFVGYGYTASSDPGNFLTSTNSVYSTYSTFYQNSAPTTSDFDWTAATSLQVPYVLIKTYMQAPVFVTIGDSIMAGYPNGVSGTGDYCDNAILYMPSFKPFHPPYGIPYNVLGDNLDYSYQNMGISGDTINSGIMNRLTEDVVNLKPKFAIIQGGINDVNTDSTATTLITNFTNILSELDSVGIIPVVLKILPSSFAASTDERMAEWQIVNDALPALVSSYGGVFVNASTIFESERASGPEGNLWDNLNSTYTSDNIHYTVAGYEIIGQAIYDAIFEAFKPQYEMGTDEISTSANVRVYGDEKFRNITTPSTSETADLNISIPDLDVEEWLDIEISEWSTQKTWTETSTVANLTYTIHSVGSLLASREYNVSVDDVLGQDITGANCTAGVCLSNASGEISFTYTGTYSSHTFSVEISDATPPTLSFTNDVSSEKVISDEIEVSWGDAKVKKWDYDSDGTCSTTSGDYSKSDSDSMDQDDRDHQYEYICLYAEDSVGNSTTLASENKINISDNLEIDDVEYTSTKDSITIKWDTNNDADSKVKYGTADGHLDEKETKSKEENKHEITLKNLNSNTNYYFRIYSEDEYGDEEKTKVYSIQTKKDYTHINYSATVPTSIIPQEEFNFTPKEEDEPYNEIAQDIQANQEMNKLDISEEKEPLQEKKPSFWVRIWNFFKGLFGG